MAAPMERLPRNTFEMRIASHDNRVACVEVPSTPELLLHFDIAGRDDNESE
jgi:hypothetical protein